MSRILFHAIVVSLFVIACTSKPVDKTMSDDQLRAKADSLAHAVILVDTHVDLPYRLKIANFTLEREYIGIPVSSEDGDFDFVRAKKGGLDAPFMSIYIQARNQRTPDYGKALADTLINMVTGIADAHPDRFVVATTPQHIEDAFKAGKIALPMGMENGCTVGMDLSNVAYFYDRGIRYITLTHSRHNQICSRINPERTAALIIADHPVASARVVSGTRRSSEACAARSAIRWVLADSSSDTSRCALPRRKA